MKGGRKAKNNEMRRNIWRNENNGRERKKKGMLRACRRK
jgi:hypothetical protein